MPWIHNVRNTDAVAAIDDEDCMRLLRLFNEPAGKELLRKKGIDQDTVEQLDLLGISSIGNLLAAIKTARWFELDERRRDRHRGHRLGGAVRLAPERDERRRSGAYTTAQAARDLERCLLGQSHRPLQGAHLPGPQAPSTT